jgi:hypothetical protein
LKIPQKLIDIAASLVGLSPYQRSTEYLLQERAEWEQQIIDAHNGEFDDNKRAIRDANEELEWINKELVRRGVIDLMNAEQFIRDNTALYRHYCISEVQAIVKQFTKVSLTDNEAVKIVQRIRDEKGLGPIADYNLPEYVGED